jgi:hypothetical protein
VSVAPPGAAPAPGTIACPRCAAVIGPDQDWCLACGAPARTRLVPTPNWRAPVAALAVIVLLAGIALAAAFVSLTNDAEPAAPVSSQAPPPSTSTAPAGSQSTPPSTSTTPASSQSTPPSTSTAPANSQSTPPSTSTAPATGAAAPTQPAPTTQAGASGTTSAP